MKAPHVFTTIGRTKFPPIPLYKSTEIQSKEAFADFDGNTQFVPYDSLNHEEIESSTTNLEPSNVHTIEPKNIKEAMADHSWIESMQDELNQFERLQVWELVPRPEERMLLLSNGFGRISVMQKILGFGTNPRLVAKGSKARRRHLI
ncbi:hypothetical protein Tco_0772636 [Tanacetum coccineum]|uniref:Gag-Pol polyprotein n=1 Tax=Tanacetum coccineum TaxID=301880 RepID=A0ABQ4ZIM6_9ASTR